VAEKRDEPAYVYVYCAVRGTPNARALTKLPSLPDAGAPRVVRLADDIALIVADVPARTYGAHAIESRLGDLDWVGQSGTAHHAVADRLAERHTVVPLRPFTLFSSEARATDTFTALVAELRRALDRVSGKAEWVLRIGQPDPRRAAERPAGPRRTPAATSGTSFLAQKAAAKKSASERAARVQRDAAALFDALARVADESSERPPVAGTGLLLDAAFLVPAGGTASFKRVLGAEAKGLLRDGCRVSLTGPWPPYSFVSLDSGSTRA
jgi:hypothetical protein